MKKLGPAICIGIMVGVVVGVVVGTIAGVGALMGDNIDHLKTTNKQLEQKVEQDDIVIYSLETRCRLQVRDIKMWEARNLALAEQANDLKDDIRGYEAKIEALYGRIDRLERVYLFREQELLDEIEQLKECDGKNQETKARQRMVHPKRPCRLLKGKRVGC